MMWNNRDYVTEAYEVTENTMQVRLSGVDLAVNPSDVGPSPFAIPNPPDTRRVILPAVSPAGPEEAEPVEIDMSDGKVRLFGTVSGVTATGQNGIGAPGPIAGATVGIERITSEGIGELLVQTNADGEWAVDRLPGGKYRVRAWIPGLLTSAGSEVRYVEDEEKSEFATTILGVDQTPTIEFVHGGAIYEGHGGAVAIAMTSRSIDEHGIVVTAPIAGSLVSIQATPEVTVASSPTQLTDGDGLAFFTLNCTGAVSGGTITATAGLVSETFSLPGCQPIPVPEPPEPEPADPATVTFDG